MNTYFPRLISIEVWLHFRISRFDGLNVSEVFDDNATISYNGLNNSFLVAAVDALNSRLDGHFQVFVVTER